MFSLMVSNCTTKLDHLCFSGLLTIIIVIMEP